MYAPFWMPSLWCRVQGLAFRVKIILVTQLGTVILTPYQARGKTEFEVGSYQAGIHRDLI